MVSGRWYHISKISSDKDSSSPITNGIRTKEFRNLKELFEEILYGSMTLVELLSCQRLVFPLVPEETVASILHKTDEDGRLNATESEEVENKAFECIETAILETNDFDKIIR
ncbi:16619_t:CDS:2 [Entrophospora sp. SA101]|nr:10812_t:CDS:2 [Entrophospora sp. SA101]CAJ0645755.1 16619_t:CDS:2 [Entrophospora sp. SA101]CAJ0834392.1 13860_t:CDS:2 [Entrophospora sp. SA101]CAJ0876885.1 7475_t:CDS:2 [Entrophospora sp. SA101]